MGNCCSPCLSLVMSVMVYLCSVLFPRDVLDEILNLIGSVSEGFPTYSFINITSVIALIVPRNEVIVHVPQRF